MYDLATLEEEIKEIIQAVELSFYEIGKRLELIKSNRLYERKGYDDFQEYVAIELKIARKSAYRQIEAAQVLDEIAPVMERVSPRDTREKYLRPLTLKRLSVEDRRNIWRSVEENLPENVSLNSLTG